MRNGMQRWMRARRARGFTLVELIVVVAILALLATFILPLFSNVQKTSAEKVSIANQEAVNRSIQTFLMLNNGGLNYLDACIDWGTPAGTCGTFNTALNSTTVVGGVFRGPKQTSFSDATAPSAEMKAQNQGISTDLAGKVCVYYLSSSDVAALNRLGLRRVAYFNYTTLHPGPRGGLTVTSDMEILNAGPGFRIEHDAAFGTALTTTGSGTSATGTAVLAVDPRLGASLYKTFGVKLTRMSDGTEITSTNTDAEAQAAAAGKVLLLFGLGQSASIVGHRTGGVDTAPRSELLDYTYYRQYFLVIRCMGGASALNAGAEFAGVIDPKGQTVTDARFANEWRNGDR